MSLQSEKQLAEEFEKEFGIQYHTDFFYRSGQNYDKGKLIKIGFDYKPKNVKITIFIDEIDKFKKFLRTGNEDYFEGNLEDYNNISWKDLYNRTDKIPEKYL